MNRNKKTITAIISAVFLTAALSCSTDLFNPEKPPQITGLTLDRYEVDPGDTLTAAVTVRDAKDKTLAYGWTATAGLFLLPSDQPAVRWKAPSTGGPHRITVTVTGEEKSASRSTDVTVRSLVLPDVFILSPQAGTYVVQHDSMQVRVRARHDNGIDRVRLFINSGLKKTADGGDGEIYTFDCPVDEPAGNASVRVEAVARVSFLTKSDSVSIHIEGVVPGKAGR
ncbi:hypothetical protein JW777_03690 [bacterium]|nr:hypothetical protein [bacterium]